MVRGVFAWDRNREELERLAYPWESWTTLDTAARIIEEGKRIRGTEWEFYIRLPVLEIFSEEISRDLTEKLGTNIRISTELEAIVKQQRKERTAMITLRFFSDAPGNEIIKKGIHGATLYAMNLPIGVHLRKAISVMTCNEKGKYFGEFKFTPYEWWNQDPELCKRDREELYSRLGEMVSYVCFSNDVENKCSFNYNEDGLRKLH